MNCTQVAECVSALFDSHQVSREVAAHLADCPGCRARLNEYAEMGAELRDLASAASTRAIPEGQWRLAEPAAANHWLKEWRGSMRIPRFAFALMLVALLALSLSTSLFLTRAKGTDRWFQYEVLGRDGKTIMGGAIPPNGEGNPYYDGEAGMPCTDGTVWFHVHMVARIGEAEKIGVRALWHVRGDQYGGKFFETLHNMPEQEFLYSPNQELKIPVENYGDLEIKGQFTSALPENVARGMYPEWGKFRIDPPVLLVRGNELLGKFISGGGELSLARSYFAYGQQDQGWYLFSTKPLEGAAEGTLTMNEIEFTLDGNQYSLFTGDPIVFGKINIWVKHYASIKDADPTSPGDGWQGNVPRLAFGELQNLTVQK